MELKRYKITVENGFTSVHDALESQDWNEHHFLQLPHRAHAKVGRLALDLGLCSYSQTMTIKWCWDVWSSCYSRSHQGNCSNATSRCRVQARFQRFVCYFPYPSRYLIAWPGKNSCCFEWLWLSLTGRSSGSSSHHGKVHEELENHSLLQFDFKDYCSNSVEMFTRSCCGSFRVGHCFHSV